MSSVYVVIFRKKIGIHQSQILIERPYSSARFSIVRVRDYDRPMIPKHLASLRQCLEHHRYKTRSVGSFLNVKGVV